MAMAIPIAMVVGSVLSAYGKQQAGVAASRAADFQAAQHSQRAGQVRAASQREAIEQRRQAALVSSAVQARAGGGGMDPGIVKLETDIAGEGEYRALTALYEGEERARSDEMGAAASIYSGKQAKRAGNIGAITSVFNSVGSAYGGGLLGKYGG